MLIFSPKAYQKIKFFTLQSDGEISGLGKSEFVDNESIVIKDIVILKQENTFGRTTLSEEAMAEFLNEKIVSGGDTADWNIWWHSHGEMEAFWSMTDEKTIETTTGGSHLISLVVNRKMEMLARMDVFNPFRLTFGLDVFRSKGRPKEGKKYLEQHCKSKIKKCVRNKPFQIFGFNANQRFLIPKKIKKQRLLSVEEILEAGYPWE